MPHFYKSKFNNSYNSVLGGSVMKTEEEKDKLKNVSILKLPEQPKTKTVEAAKPGVTNKIVNKHISDEKLKRFINFSI
jgi:hypothetical protein